MDTKPLLLVIDDEVVILDMLKESLEDEGYRVEILSEGNHALDLIGKLIPDLVLLDIFMPNCNGVELLERIKKEYPSQKVMMISGFGNISIAIQAIKKGALDFIEKPLNLDEILEKLCFLKNPKQDVELTKSKENLIESYERHGIVGQSYLFLELMQQVNRVLDLDLPITIYGQHGTGKSLIAKYIYKNYKGGKTNFVGINCSISSEKSLLNDFKIAFSKNDSFLFLKNIDDLTTNVQKELLVSLEQYGNNVRVVSSCTKNLFYLLRKGVFNEDLYHKLNVLPLEIPPLNKRRYDIPLLCDFFMKKFNQKYSKNVILNTRSIRFLRNHNWIGNVFQLMAFVEKVVLLTPDNDLVVKTDFLNECLDEKNIQLVEEQSFNRFDSLDEASKEFQKRFITYLLKKNGFDMNQVSDRLNLTALQLRDKMLEFKIEPKG